MKSLITILVLTLLMTAFAFSQWMSLTGPEGEPVAIALREDTPSGTVIEFTTYGYYHNDIAIEGRTHSVVSVPKTAIFLEKGYPELPRMNKSIMIPDDAKMNFEIVEAEYETTYVASIAPSKGSLPRSVDPEKVPYTFGEVYKTDIYWPEQVIELSEPFIMRDIRGITVRFNLFRFNAVRGQLITCRRLLVRVFDDGIDDVNVKTRGKGIIDEDFLEIYERFFLNFSERSAGVLGKVAYPPVGETGRMLIIAADDYYNSVIPLRDWRTRKGHRTTLIKCSDVGTTWQAVKSYIQNIYNTQGVTYILLVGEGIDADIPSKSIPYPGNASGPQDPTYALLEGGPTDPYPDAYISRFSAENVVQVENQVMRIMKYETTPVSGTWFRQASGIASRQGSPADTTRCNLLRDRLLGYGYTSVDKLYDITSHQPITNAINAGRGVINYLGHGNEEATAWGFNVPYVWPLFSVSNVQNLSSTNKLPFVFSVACHIGKFSAVSTCFAEAWLRSGTKEDPKGAIGFYGSSIEQPWIQPTVAQLEAVDLLVANAKITIGGLCFNGSCKMIENYPLTGPGVFNTWHIFGDAATNVWTITPVNFTSISITDNGSSITVNTGVSGSTITVSSTNNGSSYWNRRDNVSSYTFNTSVRPLYITVTKHNYIPYTAISGGTITSNEYWFGDMKVLGNVTVASGKTLTVETGSYLSFNTNISLTVNGKLIANGTSSQPITLTRSGSSRSWGPIVLNGSGASGSTLNYVKMTHGTEVQVINTSNVTISNSRFENTSYGIRFSNSTGSANYNKMLVGSGNYGIRVENGSNVTVNINEIKQKSFGISYTGGSFGYMGGNDVVNTSNGVSISNSSNPRFKNVPNAYSKNNRISYNSIVGLSIYNSFPVMYDGMICNGKQSITNNAEVDLYYYHSGGYYLDAIGVYWNGGNPANAIIIQGHPSSPIWTFPHLTTDPWAGVPLPSMQDDEVPEGMILASISLLGTFANSTQSVALDSASRDPLLEGIQLQEEGRFVEAMEFFIAYLEENPNSHRAYTELYNCYSDETADKIVSYFESLPITGGDEKLLLNLPVPETG
jgi:hypothetical protein